MIDAFSVQHGDDDGVHFIDIHLVIYTMREDPKLDIWRGNYCCAWPRDLAQDGIKLIGEEFDGLLFIFCMKFMNIQ